MKTKAISGIDLDYRRPLKDGTFPVKLRIYYNGISKFYSIKGYKFSTSQWEKIHGKKPRENEKQIKFELTEVEAKAREIIKSLQVFSFELFEKKYNEDENIDRDDIFSFFTMKQDELISEGRLTTAETFRSTKKALTDYYHKKKLSVSDISAKFLTDWQRYMMTELKDKDGKIINRKKSPNTVGIYMRNMRTLYNMAILSNPRLRDTYPFGSKMYVIPSKPKKIEALGVDDVLKILNSEPATESTRFYRDIWAFSYLVNGINLKDILNLKYSNINGNYISFSRKKNERKNAKKEIIITALLLDEAKEIIQKHGNKPVLPDSYIFPFFTKEMTEHQKQSRVRQSVKMTNLYVDRVAKKEGITIRVTSYTARHSFAFRLKEVGAPIELRSECLGHSSIKTTEEFYSRNFSNEKRDEFSLQLLTPTPTQKNTKKGKTANDKK